MQDRRRQVEGKSAQTFVRKKEDIAKIQWYEHYRKDCPKFKKRNIKKDREESHFTEKWKLKKKEVQERGKALEARARDITIGKHEGRPKQNLWQSI